MGKWTFLAEHFIPSLAGFVRLACRRPGFAAQLVSRRALYFLSRRQPAPLTSPEGFLINTSDTLIAYWSMFVERELHDGAWADHLREAKSPLVADIGANAGAFALYVHSVNPRAVIHCFEPLPAMVERIRSMAERVGMNLTCHPIALSDHTGEALFESPAGHEGTSHLIVGDQATPGAFRVPLATLDEALQAPSLDLVKIDVEGFECDVLKGATRTLPSARYLILEAQDPDHLQRIKSLLGPEWVSRRLGSSDHLFWRVT